MCACLVEDQASVLGSLAHDQNVEGVAELLSKPERKKAKADTASEVDQIVCPDGGHIEPDVGKLKGDPGYQQDVVHSYLRMPLCKRVQSANEDC